MIRIILYYVIVMVQLRRYNVNSCINSSPHMGPALSTGRCVCGLVPVVWWSSRLTASLVSNAEHKEPKRKKNTEVAIAITIVVKIISIITLFPQID